MQSGVRELFGEGRNCAILATTMADGSPHAVSLWTAVEDDRLLFFSDRTTRKSRNIERDPRVALSVVDRANPFRTAQLRGEVVETIDGDEGLAIVDRISLRYIGEPYPAQQPLVYVVEPTWQRFDDHPVEPSWERFDQQPFAAPRA
jgi:PPOX class probable F420-dependent enzyme